MAQTKETKKDTPALDDQNVSDGGENEDFEAETSYLIRSYTGKFRVWLDQVDDIDWWLGDEFEWPKGTESRFGRIQARMNAIQQWVPRKIFSAATLIRFRCLLGEAIALALEGNCAAADETLNTAEEFASQRAGSYVRLGTTLSAACIVVLGILIHSLGGLLGDGWSYLGVASAAGSLGALFSALIRTRSVPLTTGPDRWDLILQGAVRIVAGTSAALFLTVAIRAGAVLPSLVADNRHLTCAVIVAAFVAGASERLVPSLIDRFDYRTESQPENGRNLKPGGRSEKKT